MRIIIFLALIVGISAYGATEDMYGRTVGSHGVVTTYGRRSEKKQQNRQDKKALPYHESDTTGDRSGPGIDD